MNPGKEVKTMPTRKTGLVPTIGNLKVASAAIKKAVKQVMQLIAEKGMIVMKR